MKMKLGKPLTAKELETLSRQYADDCDQHLMATAVERSGLAESSLTAFGIGWSTQHGRHTFPMRDGAMKLTGFALWGGEKDGTWNEKPGVVSGSRMGLFIPSSFELAGDCPVIDGAPQTLILPQGPLDAAIVRNIGWMGVVGRPTVFSAGDDVIGLLVSRPPQELIVCLPRGDDGSEEYRRGASGAMDLIERLYPMKENGKVEDLRILTPAPGKVFRDVAVDFGMLAAHVLSAKPITQKRLEAARWRLKQLEKGRAA